MSQVNSNPEDSHDEDIEDRVVYEEYQIWKRHTPFYYELLMVHPLQHPCLQVSWLPDDVVEAENDRMHYPLLLGTSNQETDNFIILGKAGVPKEEALFDGSAYDSENNNFGGFGLQDIKMETQQKIPHDGEIVKMGYLHNTPNIVATVGRNTDIQITDTSKPLQASDDSVEASQPHLRLRGHQKKISALSWNKNNHGHLLSCDIERTICLWDINDSSRSTSLLTPNTTYVCHTGAVNDVVWHEQNSSIFGSVDENKKLMIWDVRIETMDKPAHIIEAHSDSVLCVAFNPFSNDVLVTGSADKTIALWDLRNLSLKLHSFESHRSDVHQVRWSPYNVGVLASASYDRRIHLWDLSKIGEEQTPEDAIDGPPELLFIHAGHTSHVADFSWSHHQPWLMASVADDGILQIWQMAENIYNDEEPELPNGA